MSDFQRERQALGQRLRELRRDARLTGRQLAESLCWHPSKVSRLEAGKQTPSDTDLDGWAKVCNTPEQTPNLIASLRSLESHYVEYRPLFRGGMAQRQRNHRELENETTMNRNFQSSCVPGLLQTAEYARHLLSRLRRYYNAPGDLDEAVAARLQRQQVLYQPDKKFHFLVTEGALRHRLCPTDALLGQLDRLTNLATIPTIHFGIIPFDADYPAAPIHGFAIYDERAVRIDAYSAALELTQPAEISLYLRIFADLAQAAVYGSGARALLSRILSEVAALDD